MDPFDDKVKVTVSAEVAERLREIGSELENRTKDIEHRQHIYKWLETFDTKSQRVDGGWEGAVKQVEEVSGVSLEMPRAIKILKNLTATSGGRVCIDAYEDGRVMFYYKDLNRI